VIVVIVDQLSPALIEELAVAFHELYRNGLGQNGDRDAEADRPWDQLDEATRENNRGTARYLPCYLAYMGYSIRRAAGDRTLAVSLPDHKVERAAAWEHDRWVAEKKRRGYVYGPRRDDDVSPPTHPHLVSWFELDETAREKDRVRIREAPRLLDELGFEVVETL
jgi:hypothetical protein